MATVVFERKNVAEVDLMLNAVNRYQRVVLIPQGIDPRNYAPANGEGAGFGWDAVARAVRGMYYGDLTYMSIRMAEAIRRALDSKAQGATSKDTRDKARELSARMTWAIQRAMNGGK
ncbi:hypothetical protein ACFY5K_25600 [Streptomyces griseofuscus]|uniref:hypothetical protein n=1 Tax=Streptomyces griseofuscus TaxID=146922 RepID=UPI0036C366D9